ncbi:Na+/H+ antiporter family protein [Vreelandella malpeensis]|uniref:Sodium:proton antiporter n=1 Tax=Vreelandella malpeensis TaxID=1172368 RepID=A0ABS8DRD0_9GAMM|nr:Na+/H+ antiporter NhaC family protein [Halomonas malpeensis]MCB8888803.1 sodium:proton antiporter [Halomonas malpeensis]
MDSSLSRPSSEPDRFLTRRVLPTLGLFALVYGAALALDYHINTAVLTITLMVTLCLLKMPVAIALIGAALLGALHGGLSVTEAIGTFNESLLTGAQVGMTYVMVGAFAVAIARSGLLDLLAQRIAARLDWREGATNKGVKWGLFLTLIVASLLSQNAVPVHIAFIPILIPPLLGVMNRLKIDRRAVACLLGCFISASYLLLPTGFGAIYLNEILLANVNEVGESLNLAVTADMVPRAMFWPVMGLIAGAAVCVFYSYRKPREYESVPATEIAMQASPKRPNLVQLAATVAAIGAALGCQLAFDSLLLGALVGFVILGASGVFRWREQDDVFTEGMRMMAQIAVIITLASGFSGVLGATDEIGSLVAATAALLDGNMMLGAALMLIVGLFITIGFGDSFASVPILAPIYIPLALALGFSPMATVALLGASAALGDAGSPASTITLGATAGLNADGQHDHIRDSVIPMFLHANLGMLLFAWGAAMVL